MTDTISIALEVIIMITTNAFILKTATVIHQLVVQNMFWTAFDHISYFATKFSMPYNGTRCATHTSDRPDIYASKYSAGAQTTPTNHTCGCWEQFCAQKQSCVQVKALLAN